jgi:hypothetical protein
LLLTGASEKIASLTKLLAWLDCGGELLPGGRIARTFMQQ